IHVVRRLVWTADADGRAAAVPFRVAEDRTLADVDDNPVTLPDRALVGVAHPLDLATSLEAWAGVLADYEILQPFPQLSREVLELTDEERSATALARFAGARVPTPKVVGLEHRGWRRGQAQDGGVQGWIDFQLAEDRWVRVWLDPGIAVGDLAALPEQRLD